MISVVMPLYNKQSYVENSIQSVLQQTYRNFELLVIDDGSTDTSVEIVLRQKDERIRLIQKKNGGEASARNFGILNATFDYICFIDADDLWSVNYLEYMVIEINRFSYLDFGIITSNYNILLANGKLKKAFSKFQPNKSFIVDDYFHSSKILPLVTSNTAFIPKKVFNHLGYFNEELSIGTDLEMWYRIAKNYKIIFSNFIGATYNHQALGRECDKPRNLNIKLILAFWKFLSKYSKSSEKIYFSEIMLKEFLSIRKISKGSALRQGVVELQNYGCRSFHFFPLIILSYLPVFFIQIYIRIYRLIF